MSIFNRESKYFIGIDNGVTGSIGVIELRNSSKYSSFYPTPVVEVKNYTKEEQHLKRLDWQSFVDHFPLGGMVYIERPMVDPKRFMATTSALRCLEATLTALEYLGYRQDVSYFFVDSKSWQKELLSSALIGKEEMKKGSMEVGLKLFPSNGQFIKKHKDADGLLIAEYCYRKYTDYKEIFRN